MMRRDDCLDAVELNLSKGNLIGLRNAARSLADYCRVILDEVGSQYTEYQFIKNLSIEGRYRVLCRLDKDIIRFPKFFKDVDKQRNKTEHDDYYAPSISQLQDLVEVAKKLSKSLKSNNAPKFSKSDKSPQQKLLDEWKIVVELFNSLDDYPSWAVGDLKEIQTKINQYKEVIDNLEEFETETIQEARISMLDLLNDLKLVLENADKEIEFENAQIEYEWRMGK